MALSWNKPTVSALVAAVLMTFTAGAASHLRPTHYLADTRGDRKLADVIPAEFGEWKQLSVMTGIVNPQQQQLLNELYTEQVTRSYQSRDGYRIMLSVAYGKNQNDSFQVHLPEICYPAQGFQVLSNERGQLGTDFGAIPVKRLKTTYQSQRIEPVTYWTTIGDHAVQSGVDKKLKEMEYALGGQIADGLLFRMSSIDPDLPRAHARHEQFVRELLQSLSPEDRRRLAGLQGTTLP
jgi:EpsI family protein